MDYEIKELATFARDFTLAVGLKKASFIGVSLGAWTAARVAIDYPEITDKIILISPVGTKRLSLIHILLVFCVAVGAQKIYQYCFIKCTLC